MAYTVTNLITDAYYSSSVVARQFETIQGYQLNDALNWLNQLFQDTVANSGDIPYITTYITVNGIVGQEKYFLKNVIDIQSIVFFVQSVRYEMKYVGRKKYFGTPRANNINALPLSYTWERTFGGVNLFVYFYPDQSYPFQIVGNTYPSIVSLNQDLTISQANLGQVTQPSASFTLLQGQFVVNGVDLVGTYNPTISPATTALQNFIAYINTGIIPNVTAGIQGTQFVLTAASCTSISVSSLGSNNIGNSSFISFSNFSLINGVNNQVFTGYDQFYIDYKRYQLADRICKELNFETPAGVREQLDIYRQQIIKMAEPMDLQLQKTSVLTRAVGVNWAQANIGKGWTSN